MEESSLPTLVRDLMKVGVLTCPPDIPIIQVAQILLEKCMDDMVVLDDGKAIGTVGQTELVQALAKPDFRSLLVQDIMREEVAQVPPDIPLTAAAQIMQDIGVRTVFLMHHAAGIEYPAAYLSYQHLIRYLVAQQPEDLHDLGIKAKREAPLELYNKRKERARLKNLNQ
jgi:hypothetical protein